MKITKENIKAILLIALCVILMCAAVWNFDTIVQFFGNILTVITPVIIGFCIAFVLNIPMDFIEQKLFTFLKLPNKKGKSYPSLARLFSVLLTLLVFIGAISLLMFFIIPQVTNSISAIISGIPAFTERALEFTKRYLDDFGVSTEFISDFILDSKNILTTVASFLKDNVNSFLDIGSSLVSGVVNVLLGIFLAIYFLFDKERVLRQIKRLSRAVLKPKVYSVSSNIIEVSGRSFANFISGQLIEATILGCLCFIGMLIFKMPYAPVVSVLIGICALVPILGAWVGAVISFFLIIISNPIKALWFIVFIVVLQQLEGNLIYPRVVGKQVGLPGVWVLIAVIVGTGVLGAIGALLAVPFASVIYTILTEYVMNKEKEKEKND